MDALYFPYLSLPPATWVHPALLFFDELALIAPDGGDRALHDPRTRRLLDLGMVRPEVPRGGGNAEDERILMSYLLGRATGSRRDAGRVARVHAGKLAYGPLAENLVSAGLMTRTDHEWLEGPEWVATHLMSYLALQISSQSPRPLSLITDENVAADVMAGRVGDPRGRRRVLAATRLLPVPPDTRPEDIAEFRDRHRRDLATFRKYVNDLITFDPGTAAGERRFEERLGVALEARAHLVGEMRDFGWVERGVAIALVALPTVAAPLDHAPWTMAAGLVGLGLTGWQLAAAGDRRRHAEDSRLVYSAKVVRRFPPTAASTMW